MCKWIGDAIDHLLFNGIVANNLWSFSFSILGVKWVMPLRVIDVYFSWQQLFR